MQILKLILTFGTGTFASELRAKITDAIYGDGDIGTTETYSEEALDELLYMLEEEKLAGDIYEVFYEQTGLSVFENIAESEGRHFDALLDQATSLGLDVDEILLEPAGSYVDEELQDFYDTLLEYGSESTTAALEVGVMIEEKDMIDIAAAAELVEGTQLEDVYMNLLTGSSYHLEAFEGLLA